MNLIHALALSVPQIRRVHEARDALAAQNGALAAQNDVLAAQNDVLAAQFDAERERNLQLEADLAAAASPFFHYNTIFDAQAVMRRHAASNVQPSPDHFTNFLGVKIDPQVFPAHLEEYRGQVEPIPIPANWHADIAEWSAALRAVELARGTFTMIELGCGWACWLSNAGAAARNLGLDIHLIGVEGDEGHVRFAEKTFADNGFAADQTTLVHGIAAPGNGVALFPRQAGGSWGLEPVFGASEAQQQEALASGGYDILPMYALAGLAASHARIDLLHIDIQGGEGDFIDGCMATIDEKVGFLLVGTHSRELEGRIFASMIRAGWALEIERPAILAIVEGRPVVTVDGVQGWRNPKVAAA